MELDMQQRRARIEKWAKIGVIGVAGFLVAPIVLTAIGGIIGAAIAAALGYVLVMFAPVVAMKVANWRLGAIKAEARTNPIETLQNQYIEKGNALQAFRESIKTFSAAVKNFETKVETFSQAQPDEAERFQEQLATMNKLLDYRKTKYSQAKKNLEEFELTIQKASALWDMSQEAAKMNKLAGMQTGDPFEKIKTETALDAVQTGLNRAFADLEDSLLDTEEVTQKALAYEVNPVPVMTIPVSEKVRN